MRVSFSAVLAALFVSSAVFADVVEPIAMAPATMEELACIAVRAVPGEHRERIHARPAMVVTSENAIAATVVLAPQAAAAPAITRGFQAVTDPLVGAHEGFDPADPSGAVGPQHVVGAFNNAITVHDRSGNLLSQVAVEQFWHDPALSDKFLYDPRVAYDAPNDRWVIVMLGDDTNQVRGVLNIAISASGNPAAGWRRFRVPVDPSGQLDGDVSRLAITGDQIAVTVNVWNSVAPVGTNVFTMAKAAAFAGPGLSIAGTQLPYFSDMAPVSSSDATLRIAYRLSDDLVRMFELTSTGAVVNDKTFSTNTSLGPSASCAQLGTSPPDCGYPAVHFGVSRNGTTWLVEQTVRNNALVWKIAGNTATAYVIRENGVAIVFPSLAVNRRGAALVGYVAMSSSTYPSAAYSYIDPAGGISAMQVFKSGEAPFRRERWGDFTTTAVDPVDDLSFWTLGVYANTPFSPTYDRWAAWWSYLQVTPEKPRNRAVRH
jgi:hypothetical protein